MGKVTLISSNNVISGITSLRAWESAMYSASAVLRAISVCRELRQKTGQFAYIMTKPVLDITASVKRFSRLSRKMPAQGFQGTFRAAGT